MAEEVSRGFFKWFTNAELQPIKTQYKDAVKGHAKALSHNGRLVIQGSGEGQSYTMPEGIGDLDELRLALEDAFSQLADEDPIISDRAVVRFR